MKPLITPTQRDIDTWRTIAQSRRRDVPLGEFDWPWIVLSLIGDWEANRRPLSRQPDGNNE